MAKARGAADYRHESAELPLRPEIGTQPRFKKKRPPKRYRYDSSISPALDWDVAPVREQGEFLIACIEDAAKVAAPHLFPSPRELRGADGAIILSVRGLADAVAKLKALSQPFLNWAGKAERLSFEVPTLPLFVHERLSTQAIIATLSTHQKQADQPDMFDLFADPRRPVVEQVTKAYEYRDRWVNRLILGDSLVVMNSLLDYEGLGGQVQAIYIDPPYGVKFGSNFQPFVRKRDVKHNDDGDLTREPEMVKAYRDTWELGLHSYLTYLRDRLLLARELLSPSGSVFVQIGPENIHRVTALLDEIFGSHNRAGTIVFRKTTGSTGDLLPDTYDYICWYVRDSDRTKFRQLYLDKTAGGAGGLAYNRLHLPDGSHRGLTKAERDRPEIIPVGARLYTIDNLQSQSLGRQKGEGAASWFAVEHSGQTYYPNMQSRWKTNQEGMQKLANAKRLEATQGSLRYVRFLDDFAYFPITDFWDDTSIAGFASDKLYVVQTNAKVIQRCILMTTDPGDLVLDPTCGSGTTAYVAEQWGRRWITIDTSRVPLALARQRLLTATFPWYELKDEEAGPIGGFVYKRKRNRKGEEVGGIVPHITLGSIANDEPPAEEVLVDRPEEDGRWVRVTGPFVVEATIPTPLDWEASGEDEGEAETHVERLLEVLRRSPILHLGKGRTVELKGIRPPARSLALHAEALVDATANGQKADLTTAVQVADEANLGSLPLSQRQVAIVFGPENGAVSERLVSEAAREAHLRGFTHLYVIGFAIQADAQRLVDECEEVADIAATYVAITPDVAMGDLLRTSRASQVFSVVGRPELIVHNVESGRYAVELKGLDLFDPVTMDLDPHPGDDVPCWLLDTDYNGLVFHASQVFFPRTGAWESLKRALAATHQPAVWDHLKGTTSAPFEAGEHGRVAVKVIDDRGNELMVVKRLDETP